VGGRELVGRRERELRDLRGRIVSYVPQDPSSSLNPSQRVGQQILEMLRGRHADHLVADALRRVHLPNDRAFIHRYPHQLSGGQQQRVAIARALLSRPTVLFADEPTGNLDSNSSDEILALLRRSVDSVGQTVVMVTHDPKAAAIADRLLFLSDGQIVNDLAGADEGQIVDAMKDL
jgi:ABC-type glutathione transport system ATPase component